MQDVRGIHIGSGLCAVDGLSVSVFIVDNGICDARRVVSWVLEFSFHEISEIKQRGCQFGQEAVEFFEKYVSLGVDTHMNIKIAIVTFIQQVLQKLVKGSEEFWMVYWLLGERVANIHESTADFVKRAYDLIGFIWVEKYRGHYWSIIVLSLFYYSTFSKQGLIELLGLVKVDRTDWQCLIIKIIQTIDGHIDNSQPIAAWGPIQLHEDFSGLGILREPAHPDNQLRQSNLISDINPYILYDWQLQLLKLQHRYVAKAQLFCDVDIRQNGQVQVVGEEEVLVDWVAGDQVGGGAPYHPF